MSDEQIVIVDDADNVVGSATRNRMRAEVLWHRATYVFVISTDHRRLLVHQRASNKDLWPSRWDAAVGGVVRANESYATNAAREVAEEIGIDVEPTDIGRCWFESRDCRVRGGVFVATHDGPFTFTDGEVAQVEWLDINQLTRELSRRNWCDDTVTSALPVFRNHLASR